MIEKDLPLYEIALRGIGYAFNDLHEVAAIVKVVNLVNTRKEVTLKDIAIVIAEKEGMKRELAKQKKKQ